MTAMGKGGMAGEDASALPLPKRRFRFRQGYGMMRAMTFFKPLIAVFLLLLAGGCVSPRPQEDARPARPAIARIEARGVLLVGSTGDYRPLTWRDPETGRWEGFGIEVAERIAARLGVRAEFVQTSWPTLAADVQADPPAFDLAIGGITVTDARRETMDMSDGYLANGKTILCRAEDAGRFRSLADIDRPDVRVMVNPGGLNEAFARANLPHAGLAVHPRNEEIPSLVAEGAADVMITEIVEAPWYVRNDPRLAAPLLAEPFTRGEIGVLLRKGQDDLLDFVNAALAEMAADGTLDSLKAKHGLVPPEPPNRKLEGSVAPAPVAGELLGPSHGSEAFLAARRRESHSALSSRGKRSMA